MARSDDIREDIKRRLEATGRFSLVTTAGLPEEVGFGAGELCAAVIGVPSDEPQSRWDGGDEIGLEFKGQLPITLMVRNGDPALRDRQLDLLRNALKNAVNGQSLAEITVPDMTRVRTPLPKPPKSAERRIEATLLYSYLQTGWDTADDAP